jgi:hypothetical protein
MLPYPHTKITLASLNPLSLPPDSRSTSFFIVLGAVLSRSKTFTSKPTQPPTCGQDKTQALSLLPLPYMYGASMPAVPFSMFVYSVLYSHSLLCVPACHFVLGIFGLLLLWYVSILEMLPLFWSIILLLLFVI